MDLLLDDYKWAVGYNNAAGLALVSSTIPSTDEAFNRGEIILALPNYNPGVPKIRGTGLISYAGYKSTKWGFGYWTLLQYEYLQTTFAGALGKYTGFVTIRTRIGNTAFANYNGIMNIPTPDQLEYTEQRYVAPFLTFTRMRAI